MIRRLEGGRDEKLEFSDRRTEVKFAPEGEIIRCQVHRWGSKVEEPSYSCDRAQVIEELWQFLEGLSRRAVNQGYMTEEQAREFLGHPLPTTN